MASETASISAPPGRWFVNFGKNLRYGRAAQFQNYGSQSISAAVHRVEMRTMDELHEGITRRGLDCDFSSLFRAVEKLVADRIIRKIIFDDGRTRLEMTAGHHDHLYCAKCKEVVPIPCVIGPNEIVTLERDSGIVIEDHHLILNGTCRDCRMLIGTDEARR